MVARASFHRLVNSVATAAKSSTQLLMGKKTLQKSSLPNFFMNSMNFIDVSMFAFI
jgi:hypothetical protein